MRQRCFRFRHRALRPRDRKSNASCNIFSVHSLGNTEVAPPVRTKKKLVLQGDSGGTRSVASAENGPKSCGN